QSAGYREGSVRLRRVRSDNSVIGAERQRRQALGARGGQRLRGGADLSFRSFHVGALRQRLCDRIVFGHWRRFGEWNVIRNVIAVVRRQADQPREADLLLRKIVLQRDQTLLLRQGLHLAA